MEPEPWKQRILAWRTAPQAERTQTRWQRIPRNVAESMAFEREPVPQTALEQWHLIDDGPDAPSAKPPFDPPADAPWIIAWNLLALERHIEQAHHDTAPLDDQTVRDLHTAICQSVAQQFTGWRRVAVAVGPHLAPPWHLVPTLMRDYGRDLAARIAALAPLPDERLIETLAFAEGRLLTIHPFADYNGRVTRVFLRLLLRRLDLPPVRLAPGDDERVRYLAALAVADRGDWGALSAYWRERLADGHGDKTSSPERPKPPVGAASAATRLSQVVRSPRG